MKIKTIKQQHDGGIWLQLGCEFLHGRIVVEMNPVDDTGDGTRLTATEARRLSKALRAFADGADKENAKRDRSFLPRA